tara:strand:- start:90 stop:269 length:180 start_codon:yes stop_codon:yes gene_type:complete
MFTKSELTAFNTFIAKGITEDNENEFLELLLKFETHKLACQDLGIVGVGCYRTYTTDPF